MIISIFGMSELEAIFVAAISNGASNPLISTATKVKSDYMMGLSQLNENGIPQMKPSIPAIVP